MNFVLVGEHLVALGAALGMGLAAGLATPLRRGPELLVDAVLEQLRTMPSLALLPLVAVWLVPPAQVVAVLAEAAFLPVYLHTAGALRRQAVVPGKGGDATHASAAGSIGYGLSFSLLLGTAVLACAAARMALTAA